MRTGCRTKFFVAQICNLLYRRIAFGRPSKSTPPPGPSARSGLQIRDTAEFNSALRVEEFCPAPMRTVRSVNDPGSKATATRQRQQDKRTEPLLAGVFLPHKYRQPNNASLPATTPDRCSALSSNRMVPAEMKCAPKIPPELFTMTGRKFFIGCDDTRD